MAIFDTHAHYVKNDFGEALHPLLSSMSEAGVEKIMAVGYDLDSSRAVSYTHLTLPTTPYV